MAAKKTKNKTPGRNSTSWKEGQSGNPNGRPPGSTSLTTIVKEMGEWKAPPQVLKEYRTIFPQLPEDASIIQVLAARCLLKAMDLKAGDVMAKEIWDREDGKVPFPISGTGGGPIRVKFDFSTLTVKELDILERLLGKVQEPEPA